MSAMFVERGWGQVEPNRLTGIVEAHMESQAPAYVNNTDAQSAATPIDILENGMFLCVVPNTKEYAGAPMGRIAVLPGSAPANAVPYLVFSEKKIYDERLGYCDFVDRAADKVDGLLYPRLIGMTPDTCVFTTNTLNCAKYNPASPSVAVGQMLYINDDGYLDHTPGTNEALAFQIVKVYTMPDGQTGVKVQAKNFPVSK